MELKIKVVENLGGKEKENPVKHCLPQKNKKTEKLHQSFLLLSSWFCSLMAPPHI